MPLVRSLIAIGGMPFAVQMWRNQAAIEWSFERGAIDYETNIKRPNREM
jgi:hypothetical protein